MAASEETIIEQANNQRLPDLYILKLVLAELTAVNLFSISKIPPQLKFVPLDTS